MSRKIKFRALKDDISNCNFFYGYLVKDEEGNPYITEYTSDRGYIIISCLKGTEGQFTGLKDKNGVEIYEGDIVRHERVIEFPDNYHTGEPEGVDVKIIRIGKCIITPSKGVCFSGHKTVEDYHLSMILEDKVKWRGALSCLSEYGEVIGDIYKNKELLQ